MEGENSKKALEDFKMFFTEEQITNGVDRSNIHPSKYNDNLDKLISKVVKIIKDKDIQCVDVTPFEYFKQFKVSAQKQFSNITLYGESGLGLDLCSKKEVNYYKENGELCYVIESIAMKYHYLGMLMKQQDTLLVWIDKITKGLTNELSYFVKGTFTDIIYDLSLESVSDIIIEDIQKQTGVVEGFMTHDQISKGLDRYV